MSSQDPPNILILGAGIIGLTTSLVLRHAYPTASITLLAQHFPGDRSIDYTSPWAGANWCSMAHDNGPLEKLDEVTFHRFGQIVDGESVHGVRVVRSGEGNEAGLGRMGMWAFFDSGVEEAGVRSEATGRIWYDGLVGGLREMGRGECPEGSVFGLEFPSTFRINTQVYLQWCVGLFYFSIYLSLHPSIYPIISEHIPPEIPHSHTLTPPSRRLQSQALSKGIKLSRRHVSSITEALALHPETNLVLNATGLGALKLEDVRDLDVYPTRGQTLLVAEPEIPLKRMYEFERTYAVFLFSFFLHPLPLPFPFYPPSPRVFLPRAQPTKPRYLRSPARIDPTTTYIFPRPLGGGVILGGSRQDNDWSAEWDSELEKQILERCCALAPELGRPEDLQVLSRNVGLRREFFLFTLSLCFLFSVIPS